MLNSVHDAVLKNHGLPLRDKPVFQRNQNQSAVGGSDVSNPFSISIEVKRQEQLSVNTWWAQCLAAAAVHSEIPVLVYRRNSQKWSVILFGEIPLPDGTAGVRARCEISMDDFLQWSYNLIDRQVRAGVYPPK